MSKRVGRLVSVSIIAIVVMLGVSSFATNEVYAHHLSDDLKWQLIVITSNSACGNYDIQMTNKYSEITEKYLALYQVENTKYDPLCYSEEKYISEYLIPLDLDLVLLVYDQDIGRKELHSQNIGGFYHHFGIDKARNHVIVVCDCPTFNYSNPVWILTHELSHFTLYYLGYDEAVIEDYVHANDLKYDECIKNYNSSCKSIVQHIRPQTTSYQYSVMPIFEPAVGTEIKTFENNIIPAQTIELGKLLTTWWATGKISEVDYTNALGLIMDKGPLDGISSSEIHFADSALDKTETWQDILNNVSQETSQDVFRLVPTSMKPKELIEGENEKSKIPDWFKETGNAWVEGKIADYDFVDIINYFYTERIITLPEKTSVTESISDDFKIDFETQQRYFAQIRNEIIHLENAGNEQEATNLEEILRLHQYALKYYYHGNYADASTYYAKVLELDPQNVRALYNKGVSLARQNMFEDAIDYFNMVVEIETEKAAEVEIVQISEKKIIHLEL